MKNNILTEPIFIQKIYHEYCNDINLYQNFNRPSIFIKYLNINKRESIIDTQLNSTFDKFTINGIIYDIYEYTPLYYIAPIINDSTENLELTGQIFQENSSVTIYTIKEPNINDIVVICYPPINKHIYMRVTNIKASINAMNNINSSQLNWFDLTLERAPLMNLDSLNFHNHFIYLLTEEKNIKYSNYILLIDYISCLEKYFNELEQTFDHSLELYYTNNFISINQNKILFNYLATSINFKRYFENVLKPFGVFLFDEIKYTNRRGFLQNNINDIIIPNIYIKEIIKYNKEVDLYNMNELLKLFMKFIDNI
jgi:hypothetical protein